MEPGKFGNRADGGGQEQGVLVGDFACRSWGPKVSLHELWSRAKRAKARLGAIAATLENGFNLPVESGEGAVDFVTEGVLNDSVVSGSVPEVGEDPVGGVVWSAFVLGRGNDDVDDVALDRDEEVKYDWQVVDEGCIGGGTEVVEQWHGKGVCKKVVNSSANERAGCAEGSRASGGDFRRS